jgi:L-ascorbate metabolism protein UlaG (beta-lactamase superfamily)
MSQSDQIKLKSIGNCGVLITKGNSSKESILVDGIFGETPYFSPLPKEVKKACFGMGEEYRHIDHLIFTHRHQDHFHAGFVKAYVRSNCVKSVIVPTAGPDPTSYLEDRGSLKEVIGTCRLEEPEIGPGGRKMLTLSETVSDTAEYLCCNHLDSKTYPAVMHCAVLLSAAGKKLLFLADADTSEENRDLFADIYEPDIVFVTPLFYLDPRGRHILQSMSPKRTFLYHIPCPADDVTGLKGLAEKLLKEHTEDETLKIFEADDTVFI